MRRFGLIGYPLDHSFSPAYFREKFSREQISDTSYEALEIRPGTDLGKWLRENRQFEGLNVTIPYKETILPFLEDIDSVAREVGSVNTLRRTDNGWKGYNTDVVGFDSSLENFLKGRKVSNALILGTGGAAKAIAWVLKERGTQYSLVSRKPEKDQLAYSDLKRRLGNFELIVNTTPLGTYPDNDSAPEIPYNEVSDQHLFFDLVYNPSKTLFLKKGQDKGAAIRNGYEMLIIQADASWNIWNQE